MRRRSWFLALVALLLLPLCVRVWAEPTLRQVASRTFLPGAWRSWPPLPVPDVGDAPDSTNSRGSPMSAYPGVPAGFRSVITAGSPPPGPLHRNETLLFCLGTSVTAESEADSGPDADGLNNLDPAADRADRDRADDGLVSTLPNCAAATLRFAVTAWPGAPSEVFLNVWADWDRNGRWGGSQQCPGAAAPEWAVRNQVVPLPGPGTYALTTSRFIACSAHPEMPIWLRLTVANFAAPDSCDDGSGPEGGYCYGETEDYLLASAMTQPTCSPEPTIKPTCTEGPKPTATQTPIPPACVTAPTLISPTNGATLNTIAPVFVFDTGGQWNANRFDLQVSRQANFSPLRYSSSGPPSAGVNTDDLTFNLEAGVKFYWRVRLTCGQTQAPWSAVWSFTTASGGALPPAPALLVPISGTIVTSGPVMVFWAPVPSAIQYMVIWRKASTPTSMTMIVTSGTQAELRHLDPATLYEWSVSTRSVYGWGGSSTWWRFTSPPAAPGVREELPVRVRRRVDADGNVYWVSE